MVHIALGSITLGLAVMIIALATVTGFQKEIRDKVSGFSGHIQIQALSSNVSQESNPIDRQPEFLNKFISIPNIRHFQVFATKPGIIRNDIQLEGIVFKGIAPCFNDEFFRKHLVSGNIPLAGDTTASQEILISEWLATRLGLKTGSKCELYFSSNNSLRPRRLVVSGIYNTGLFEIDKQLVIGDLIHIQKINDWNKGECGGIEVFLKDFSKLDNTTDRVMHLAGYKYNVVSIRQKYSQIFQWLDLLDLNVYIIISLMILVAAINMITTLLIIIIEKTRVIGVLKSLGETDWGVRKIFLYNAAILISRGLLFGNLLGLGICFLQEYTGFFTLNPESYYVSVVPVSFNWLYIVLLNFCTIVLCLIMLLIPSHLISRISPVKAIKTD